MDEREILHHLLDIESEAASLVADAQAEADRRTAEGEKEGRAAYELRWTERSAQLEAEFLAASEKATREIHAELAAYREELARGTADRGRFGALASELVRGEH